MDRRIAIVTPTFPPYRGGIGQVALKDAEQLASLGYEVHVFTPQREAVAAGPDATFKLHRLPALCRYGNAAFVPAVRRRCAGFPTVLLHYPFFGGAEPLALWRRRRGQRLLVMYHMDVIGRGALAGLFSLHTRFVMPRIVAAADRVLVTSFDYAASSAVADLYEMRRASFSELPPSVDTETFRPGERPPNLLARHSLGPDERIVLFVGGLDRAHYFKGVPHLLQAVATRELAEVRCLIVGDGDLRPEFERQAERLGIAGRTVFVGSVSGPELPQYLRLADVFAFPSVDRSEAFGIAALEALASGVPVVASDLRGVRTIVRDGINGHLVPPGSISALTLQLNRLFGDPERRRGLAAAARKMAVEEYAEPRRTERWRAILERVGSST